MSEADNQATNILLPEARVAVFSKDQGTLETARTIPEDWRFARVQLETTDGDTQTATQMYQEQPSPDLLIVQTDSMDDAFIEQLEGLAAYCDEDTSAIVIGPDNDVSLYRRLIEMGISDYLVRPVEMAVFTDVIAKALISKKGVTESRLVAVIGSKGGVGATAMTQALAWSVADIVGQKACVLDAAGGWSSMSVGFGFEPSTTLTEAARAAAVQDEDSIKRMFYSGSENLNVLASGGDVMLEHTIDPEQMEQIIDMLLVKSPSVFFDLSGAEPAMAKMVIGRANEIVVVATPSLPSLRLARSLIQEIKDLRGGGEAGIEMIINMQGMAAAHEVPKGDIESAMDFKVTTTIPFLPKIFMGAESESKKISDAKDGQEVIQSYLMPILSRILHVNLDAAQSSASQEDGLFGGLLKKLKTK